MNNIDNQNCFYNLLYQEYVKQDPHHWCETERVYARNHLPPLSYEELIQKAKDCRFPEQLKNEIIEKIKEIVVFENYQTAINSGKRPTIILPTGIADRPRCCREKAIQSFAIRFFDDLPGVNVLGIL